MLQVSMETQSASCGGQLIKHSWLHDNVVNCTGAADIDVT